jgi:hypothetical protein
MKHKPELFIVTENLSRRDRDDIQKNASSFTSMTVSN